MLLSLRSDQEKEQRYMSAGDSSCPRGQSPSYTGRGEVSGTWGICNIKQ